MSIFDYGVDPRDVSQPGFNYKFLVFMIVCGLLAILFLLYFNRLFASIVSYAIRTWTWHRYQIYIDITALQISLLGGRVFFTGLRYHGSNESFYVQHGYVTWQYWLRRVREVEIASHGTGSESGTAAERDKNATLPCRINVNLIGLEWFVYNRSPAYDTVLAGLSAEFSQESQSTDASLEKEAAPNLKSRKLRKSHAPDDVFAATNNASSSRNDSIVDEKGTAGHGNGSVDTRPSTRTGASTEDDEGGVERSELPFLLQLLPVHVDCQKAAMVMGNDNTKAILVAKADSVSADVDALATNTPDPYRQQFKVKFHHPVIEMKENEEFKEDQVTRATRGREIAQDTAPPSKTTFFRHQRRKVASSLRNMVPYWRRSVESFASSDPRADGGAAASRVPGSNQWQGLSRYLDDRDQDDKSRWSSVEYAAETTILDSTEANLTVYWDVVAEVTEEARRNGDRIPALRINGDKSPAWGMHVSVRGGIVNYGPWADRQRADLQRVFFPTLAKDASPARPLSIGEWRTPTQFDLLLELDDAVTFRVPMKEDSKNWRWRGKEPQLNHSKAPNKRKQRNRNQKNAQTDTTQTRPAGWLEVKAPANTTVTYAMDMLAGSAGYENHLDIDLPSTELWSSVNHDLLWQSGPQRISCDLSNPLSWNSLRNWHFNVDCDGLDLYILRDHIFLLIDLVDDWSSGPPPEYLVFTPFKYHLNLNFRNLKLFLNINDENVIDKATALDDNNYLTLSSPFLAAKTTIPIDKYRPHKNSIPFQVQTDALDLMLNAPQWNTLGAFLRSNDLGHVDGLVLDGSYQYNATTSPANTDTLVLNVYGQSAYAWLYGFVVRYFILLKDNYFGDHIHFKTLDEYQVQLNAANDESAARPPTKKSNDLDVILGIKVDDCKAMLPTNLYSSERFVQCDVASLAVDLRFTNYYMDMDLAISPLSLSIGRQDSGMESPDLASSNTQLFIDGVRVYGHRLFGLPPTEPTYLCNWDVSVGAVVGECDAGFLAALAKGGAAFDFLFDDVENAVVPYSSLIFHDVTFARVAVKSVCLWVHIDEAAFLLATDTIQVDLNDWARPHYSKRANIHLPNVRLSCINAESAVRQKVKRDQFVETEAFLQTDIRLAIIGRKFHFSEERRLQQELLHREDYRTLRTPFLKLPQFMSDVPALEAVDPPAQCAPPPPEPVLDHDGDNASSFRSRDSARSSRRDDGRSFISSAASARAASRPRNRRRSYWKGPHAEALGRHRHGPSNTSQGSTSPDDEHQGQHAPFNSNGAYSSVAFSSQYFPPHFHLHGVEPDTREAVFRSYAAEDEVQSESEDELFSKAAAALEDIDPDHLSEAHAYSSILVEVPSGINAFIKPGAVRNATSLLSALQQDDPEDVLDAIQVKAMTEIFEAKKISHINGQIKDLLIKLPSANVRFLNSSNLDSPDPSQEEQDQYDLRISKVAVVTRTTIDWDGTVKNETAAPRTSLHLRVGSTELSASERLSSLEEPQAAVMLNISDVMVSVGAREVTYFDADAGAITGSSASGKIEYLASLVHRTGSLASELARLVTRTASNERERAKFFVYKLLQVGQSTNDPSFLIRPSAVLRSAPQHLRTSDSWKLMMHLRQILFTMDDDIVNKMIRGSTSWGGLPAVPPDAAQLVLAAFQRWRSWDLEDPSQSVLVKNLFGSQVGSGSNINTDFPLLGACRLTELQYVLDPGPKQNKVSLTDLNARVEKLSNKAGAPTAPAAGKPESELQWTVVNLFCGDAAINLNWELCELVDDVLELIDRNRPDEPQFPTAVQVPSPVRTHSGAPVHVVVELAKGSIDIETVNLKAQTLSDGFKASAVTCVSGERTVFQSLMLHCNAVTTMLYSHSQYLSLFQLKQPSVFVSHELQETDEASLHAVKATASSSGLTFAMKQDMVALLEIADVVLRDEIAYLYRFKRHTAAPDEPKSPVRITDRLSKFKLNVVMFLDGYSVMIPLVQTMTYQISGVVARAACAANFGQELIFDFDVKENSHELRVSVRNEPQVICLLQMPPTNGRVVSRMRQAEHLLTILSSVEVINLDASAVYNLLTALSRPQISSAIEDVKEQVAVIQEHVTDIFGSNPSSPHPHAETPKSILVYNAHLTFTGLQLLAKTTLHSDTEPLAQVLFSLDKMCMQASNRHESHGPVLRYPDVSLNLRQIGLDIRRGRHKAMRSCGSVGASVTVSAALRRTADDKEEWSFNFKSDTLHVSLSPETISTLIDVLGYMADKIQDLDSYREVDYLKKLKRSKPRMSINKDEDTPDNEDFLDSVLASVIYRVELRNIQFCWIVADAEDYSSNKEDLVCSIELIEFGTRSKKSARLTIENLRVQTVPPGQDKSLRSFHSALLPQVMFNIAYVSTAETRRLAFQAVGESLDLKLTSGFIVPAAFLADSISMSTRNVQTATAQWNIWASNPKESSDDSTVRRQNSLFGKKRFDKVLMDADFAGAVVEISSKRAPKEAKLSKYGRPSLAGKYGQFNTDDTGSAAILRSPGLAWKAEYRDNGHEDPALHGEIRIDASSNILFPSVVPLVMDIMSSIKEVVSDSDGGDKSPEPSVHSPPPKPEKSGEEDNILTADPSAVLGRLRLNLGLRICRQEFSLSCQPIARVAATTSFENIYFTINTVTSQEHGSFFAISGEFLQPQASVQHVYSQESTGSFRVDTVTLSFMNSKHVSGTSGVSVILNVSPMEMSINAKQVQDFLLFREIWYPKELRRAASAPVARLETETSQGHLVQRYQQVAATAAFPWTVTISVEALDVNVDFGQAIGRSVFIINDFWVSSKKTSDWEQNLCLGFKKIGIDSNGRLSGFISLRDFQLRTCIQWPRREEALSETPLVQASIGFNALQIKAAFDYQAFLVADITSLSFLMYNVRDGQEAGGDRLVAMFDGEAVQVFGTTNSAAQSVALFQAFQKLFQERRENFQSSLRDLEKFMKRKSTAAPRSASQQLASAPKLPQDDTMSKSPISLQTDVVVTLKALNLGVFPSTFSDHQVFKVEALDAYARFAASVEQRRIHSILRMTLGQLRIGLAGVRNVEAPKALSEILVEDVVRRATGSRGGTILKVPRVAAAMETWQRPNSNHIDYIFKSAFEGKVEVGWNYSRVSYIRGMFAAHLKSLEQVWGRELSIPAVKITGVEAPAETEQNQEQQKITAEVNVPQSKYDYTALEPPVIETPQLRDMGEATPPLEWIGLHRDRLPNLTHQIVIVSLLELAGEVEDAYSRILGSS